MHDDSGTNGDGDDDREGCLRWPGSDGWRWRLGCWDADGEDEEPKKPDGLRESESLGVCGGAYGLDALLLLLLLCGVRASWAALRRRLVVPFDFVVPERAEQTTTTRCWSR